MRTKREQKPAMCSGGSGDGRGWWDWDIASQRYGVACLHNRHLLPGLDDQLLSDVRVRRHSRLYRAGNGTQERVEYRASCCHGLSVNDRLLAVSERTRGRAVGEADLFVGPHWVHMYFIMSVGHANTSTSTSELPVLEPVDAQFREDLVNGAHETVHLLKGVSRCDGNPETFLAARDRGVVDRLNIDIVFCQQFVRGGLG